MTSHWEEKKRRHWLSRRTVGTIQAALSPTATMMKIPTGRTVSYDRR